MTFRSHGQASRRRRDMLRCTLLGVGAMASPRYRPAGLLVVASGVRLMFDGGPGAEPPSPLDGWLVTDAQAELATAIRRLAAPLGLRSGVRSFSAPGLTVEPLPVRHTSHPAFGYRIEGSAGEWAVWAPEFLVFPAWAAGTDLMFADGAGWNRPIRFAGGVGGHAAARDVSRAAREAGVRRLVLAHLGRPTIRALDAGSQLPFGEIGVEGRTYRVVAEPRAGRAETPRGRSSVEPASLDRVETICGAPPSESRSTNAGSDAPGRRWHQALPHTADVGLTVAAPTLTGLFEETAAAFAELTADLAPRVGTETSIVEAVSLTATDGPSLVVAWLNELIGLGEVHHAALLDAVVSSAVTRPTARLRATVHLLPYAGGRARARISVKSATYHRLSIQRVSRGWRLTVYLDV